MNIRNTVGTLALAALLSTQVVRAKPSANQKTPSNAPKLSSSHLSSTRIANKPHIDIVFAIDCSGSMGGVIETAKQKVWTIVNEVGKAKPTPVLRIGLMGYGNADASYRKFDLSDDLDEVYKNLMTFKDEGWGSEYVGLAIHKVTHEMSWAKEQRGQRNLRIIYVVGNETARQGPEAFDYSKTAPAALKNNLLVNAIYCGDSGGVDTWVEFAKLGEGKFMQIAGDGGSVTIPTPYDAELQKLSSSINNTYVAYGALAAGKRANQIAQDANAASVGGAANAADRANAKASAQYNNRSWDIVDAAKEKNFDWSKIKTEDLPEEMRSMNLAQRKAYVARKTAERAAIQNKIRELSAKRGAYIEAEMKKKGAAGQNSLDLAIRRSVVQQAQSRGFKFEK